MNHSISVESILKKLEYFVYKRHLSEVFKDAIQIAALTISIKTDYRTQEVRVKALKQIRSKYEGKELVKLDDIISDIFSLLISFKDSMMFDDHLGKMFMLSMNSNKYTGQYFTPYDVSRLTAQITFNPEIMKDKEVITVLEPACGSGGMVLAFLETAWQNGINYTSRIVIEAVDIDERCVAMTYLQLAFAGASAIVKLGNSLTEEFSDIWYTPGLLFQPNLMKRFQTI